MSPGLAGANCGPRRKDKTISQSSSHSDVTKLHWSFACLFCSFRKYTPENGEDQLGPETQLQPPPRGDVLPVARLTSRDVPDVKERLWARHLIT